MDAAPPFAALGYGTFCLLTLPPASGILESGKAGVSRLQERASFLFMTSFIPSG